MTGTVTFPEAIVTAPRVAVARSIRLPATWAVSFDASADPATRFPTTITFRRVTDLSPLVVGGRRCGLQWETGLDAGLSASAAGTATRAASATIANVFLIDRSSRESVPRDRASVFPAATAAAAKSPVYAAKLSRAYTEAVPAAAGHRFLGRGSTRELPPHRVNARVQLFPRP